MVELDITYFIRELILMNECVILRGIGGFETTYKNAVLDKENKSISPPGKKIHFRSDLVRDNGVLENHIAKSMGIDKGEVSDSIDAFVQEFHDIIRDEGKITLKGIGEFTLAKDSSIIFHEIRDENYLADSFGLDNLDIELGSSELGNKKGPESQPKVQEKKKLRGWYIALGVLLLLIIGTTFIMFSEFSFFEKSKEGNAPEQSEVVVIGPAKTDSTIQAIGKSIDESTLPKKALSVEFQDPDISYYIIAGSFKIRQNAERLEEMLRQKGFNPSVMEKGNFVRVVIGTFDNKKLAIAELRRVRAHFDQSVWLMEEKN